MPVGGLSSTLRQAAELRASMTTASSDSSPRPIHRQNTMPTNNNYSYEPAQMIIPQQSYLPNQSHGSSVNHNESVGYESINVYENDPSSNRQGQRHSDRHPQENPATYSSSASKNTNSIHSHRQAWQTHGLGLTQALADHRRQHGGWKVKLTQAVQRLEIGSNTRYYTAYLLQVTAPPETTTPVGSSWTVERRYSEFAKLHDLLDRHNIRISTVNFPSKHNMGRWLITGGHQSQEDVTQYRLIQLDVWMVHVVDWYNTYCEQPQQDVLATAFNKFLTQSFQPPCLDENYLPSNLERSLWSTSWKWHNPICSTLGSSLRQATWTIQQMTTASMDQSIPVDLLQAARGLLFLTVVKAGMVVSGRVGTGLVVARLASSTAGSTTSDAEAASWSAPCAVGTVGMGWGALIGGDVTHYLIVLTTDQAVLDLVSINKSRSVQLGAELGVAVGPVGRGATGHVATGDWTLHPAYAYAHSQGLFAGISVEGSIITVRDDVNSKFYACACNPRDLLRQRGPKAAEHLYQALDDAMAVDIPDGAFRPTQFFSPDKKKAAPTDARSDWYLYHDHPARDASNPQHPSPSSNHHVLDSRKPAIAANVGGLAHSHRAASSTFYHSRG